VGDALAIAADDAPRRGGGGLFYTWAFPHDDSALHDALDLDTADNGHAVWVPQCELQNRSGPDRDAPHRLPNSD